MTRDPPTDIYRYLTTLSTLPGRVKLLHDDLTDQSYLEITRELPDHVILYHVLTWPVAAEVPVPVLYFNVHAIEDGQLDLVTDVSAVMDFLVPEIYRAEVSNLPALSQGMHPVTGLPAFFVHPCKTQDWMRLMGDIPDVYPLWFQTFGQVVGL